MKTKLAILEIYSTVVSYLYIFLFVYAAVSKLLDFENFKVQLGQSPLISAFAFQVSVAVPLMELIIAAMLAFPFLRFKGLLAGYILMTMFTIYIYLILNYSAFIPCSCGGILEKMNWDQHLIFNIIMMILAIPALVDVTISKISLKRSLFSIGLTTALGVATMVGLFLLSENKMKYDNGFIRRFPQHSAQKTHERELNYNSYYFAGSNEGKIYLGNSTSPLLITIIDTTLQSEQSIKIQLKEKNLPFRKPSIRVFDDNFYVYEGNVPYVFKGSIKNWSASLRLYSGYNFSQFEPIDSVNIAVRYNNPKTAENLIGTLNLADTTDVNHNAKLLQKQIDGIFDTDGKLLVNHDTNDLVYLYRYRNEYVIANQSLQFKSTGKTIDTVSYANLKITSLKTNSLHKLSEPPLVVNKTCYIANTYLYVNSVLRGKYESDYKWKNTSTVDVYRLTDHSYQYSLSVDAIGHRKMKSFIVQKDRLYALIGTKIVAYKLIDYKVVANISPNNIPARVVRSMAENL